MKYTAKERVQKGIARLDQTASYKPDILSPFWRNHVSVKDIRIDNPDKGIVGQLFGNYRSGTRKMGLFGYYSGSHLGFLHYPRPYRDNTRLLREAWEEALKTDPNWKYDQLFECHKRWVNGILYLIFPYTSGNVFNLRYKLGDKNYTGEYTSLESAKRSVRKLATRLN